MKDTKIIDYRCPKCNTLFCKTDITSVIEVKCRKCKNYSVFNKGVITNLGLNKDTNNYFKGDE